MGRFISGERGCGQRGLDRRRAEPTLACGNEPGGNARLSATEPAKSGNYPRGDLFRVDLLNGQMSIVTAGPILGASGITFSADERQVFVTEFGHEKGCGGSLSAVNIDPGAADFGQKMVLVSGLCDAHGVQLNGPETLVYLVEVDASPLSVI